jgi:glycopeptide antibiotics resistance protein
MYTYGYLFYIPISVLYSIIILLVGLIKKRPFAYYLIAIIFGVYINLAIEKVFFPLFLDGSEFFTSIKDFIDLDFDINKLDNSQIIGNIIVTFPIGILIPFILNIKNKIKVIIVLIISISLEFFQLLIISSLHPINIFFDIKDIILNVTGGMLGCIAFIAMSTIISKIPEKNEEYRDLFSYIYIVCKNTKNGNRSLYMTERKK